MYNFSNEAKTRIIEGKIIRAYLRVLATDTLPEIRINEENYLKDIQFEDFRYVPDEGIIGGTVAKKVIVNFANVDETFSIQDREFELYIGVELSANNIEYQKYGTFIVQKPENDQVNDNTYCEALDYMIKLNKEYVDRITYPCTLKQLFNDVVSQAGMQTNLQSFDNDNFIVENNQFEEGATLRDVLKAIGQVAFNWIVVDENNYITMDFEIKDTIDETLDIDKYFDLSKQDEYGPINMIVFKDSQIEGQEEIIRDTESISEYGENELAIVDNPFAYTQEKKQELIEAGRKMFGFRYIPITLNAIGYIYLNRKDKIRIETLNEQELDTYILNHTINYNGVALDSIESPAETKAESKYEYNSDIDKRTRRTELKVDRANQKIEGVINEIGDRSQKTTTITADLDGLQSQVSNIATFKITQRGTKQIITQEDTAPTQIIRIQINGYLESNTNNLYAGDDYVSQNTFVKG